MRRVSPAQNPEATPSTPKSPNRVSLSSSVPYIVRFICAPGVSGGKGRVLLMPSWMPTSVLDTVRRGKNERTSEFSAIATLGTLAPSGGDSGTEGSIGLAISAFGSTVPLPSALVPAAVGCKCDAEGAGVALWISGLATADCGREGARSWAAPA